MLVGQRTGTARLGRVMQTMRKPPHPARQFETPLHVLMTSVMHSGTHLLMWDLFSGWEDRSSWTVRGSNRGYEIAHLDDKMLQRCLETDAHVVAPVRSPTIVARSWKSRGKSVLDMLDQYGMLTQLLGHAHLIPIDTILRCEAVSRLNEALGIVDDDPLRTDWPVLRYDDDDALDNKLTDRDVQDVSEFCFAHSQFLTDMGYEVRARCADA